MEMTDLSNRDDSLKECIHLTKNTKGYNWELKIFPIPLPDHAERLDELDIQRLERLNDEMIKRWGVAEY